MTTNTNESTNCPSCGNPMPAGALAGLCPACLLAQGAETEAGGTQGRSRFEPPALADVAKLFPQLEVISLLGAGGMGAVYQARQPKLDRLVALKILPAGGSVGSAERFNREARALARLSHPNIVTVHEFGQVEGLHFFIMEFVDGTNLRQLEKTSRLSPREALQIIPQICDALQYAHDEGVVHRDIKPENVLVDRKGRVKIADFGLAKIVDPDPEAARLTVDGQVMGTPHYMAPEQVERPLAVDHRADIYALGVVFYEMLTGDLPLGKFPPPSRKVQVDVRLDDIVLRALENDPDRRYQHASDVKSEVQTVSSTTNTSLNSASLDKANLAVSAEFSVEENRDVQRQVEWKETIRAWAVILLVLMIAYGFFSALTGAYLMGRLGVVGWQSLVWRNVIGGILVTVALRKTLRPNVLPSTFRRRYQNVVSGWRARALQVFIFVALASLASTWMAMQDRWIMPRLLGSVSGSEYGDLRVASKSSDSGIWSVTLADGSQIELLALAPGDATPSEWRRPDGRSLDETKFEIHGVPESRDTGRPTTKFIFREPAGSQALETSILEFSPAAGISAGGPVWQNGAKLEGAWPVVAAWSEATNKATLRLGLRNERWRTIAALSLGELRRVQTWAQSGEPKWITHFNHVSDDGTNTTVTTVLNGEMKDWRMQVIALDKEGREHSASQANISPFENASTWTCTFPGLTQEQIKEIQVQAKPIHWIEFRNLAIPSPSSQSRSQTHAVASFGPARQIAFDELLDLDTGRLGSFPQTNASQNIVLGIDQNIAWMQEQGFDVEARSGAIGLLGVKVVRLLDSVWETSTPATLETLLGEKGQMQTEVSVPSNAPVTLGFRTREGTAGIMQLNSTDSSKPAIHLRMKRVFVHQATPVLESPPKFTAAAIAAEPELRFLAWQDQWTSNGVASAFHPDGTAVTNQSELTVLQHERPTEFSVHGDDPALASASFLHLWFAHPAFDRQSLVQVTLTGADNRPLDLGARGRSASSVHPADEATRGRSWMMVTLCPADGIPPSAVNVQLDYAAGPLQNTRSVATDFSGMMVLEGEAQLTAVGSNSSGKAFVTLTIDSDKLGARRFGALALATDGRELIPSGHSRNYTPGSRLTTETFEFDLPLDQLKEFQIGTRAIRTARWKDVKLPPIAVPTAENRSALKERQESFGPVVDCAVPEPFPPDFVWFDLDAHKLVSLTSYFKPRWNAVLEGNYSETEMRDYNAEFKRVKVDSGVDISARIDGIPPGFGRMPGVVHKDMVVVPVDDSKWETITPDELRATLAGHPVSGMPAMEYRADHFSTYAFRTLEGGTGIIQLLAFSSRPRSIHIRYRLLADQRRAAQNLSTNADSVVEIEGGGKFDTIQAAVDAAPDNAVIHIGAGHFAENIVIARPLTLVGAGWEKTTVESAISWHEPTEAEFEAIQKQWSAASTSAERTAVQNQARTKYSPPVISVQGVQTLRIEGIRFHLAGVPAKGKLLPASVVAVADSSVILSDCAIVGSPANGLVAESGANVSLDHCLVAAAWNTGLRCEPNASVTVANSDIRNCYYAGIRAAAGSDLKINSSRISGAAWHGIRYDSTSPEIVGNLIFGNARSGVYASGDTKASIRGNVFFGNEMGGMSCWFENSDLISGNTFFGNKREALSVLGRASPQIVSNVFVGHPVAISQGLIGGQDLKTPLGKPDVHDNIFWNNESVARIPVFDENHQISGNATNLPPESRSLLIDPQLRDASEHDFQFATSSPAASSNIGAQSPLAFASSFPIQPEEKAIIPETDTRDYRQWKHPDEP
ncbi:protein kinase [bacterium]|nr:protein kinase [bacterium]